MGKTKGLNPKVYSGDGSAKSYAMKRAARVGDKTDHGDLIQAGSPDVLVNGKSSVRVELDILECQLHGPEKVGIGSEGVLINGMEAVRQWDIFEGSGPSNPVVEGSNDVRFGDTGVGFGFGLDDDAFAAEYCKQLCALVKKWPKLSQADRTKAVENLAHWLQDRAGLPRSSVSWGGGASFNRPNWHLTLPQQSLAKNKIGPNEFGGNIYHETRHSQQGYTAIRYRIAQEREKTGTVDAEALAKNMQVPLAVVQRAIADPPLVPGSREYRFGRVMDHSLNRDWVPEYSWRAHERDARMVGYRGDCFGCC